MYSTFRCRSPKRVIISSGRLLMACIRSAHSPVPPGTYLKKKVFIHSPRRRLYRRIYRGQEISKAVWRAIDNFADSSAGMRYEKKMFWCNFFVKYKYPELHNICFVRFFFPTLQIYIFIYIENYGPLI